MHQRDRVDIRTDSPPPSRGKVSGPTSDPVPAEV